MGKLPPSWASGDRGWGRGADGNGVGGVKSVGESQRGPEVRATREKGKLKEKEGERERGGGGERNDDE